MSGSHNIKVAHNIQDILPTTTSSLTSLVYHNITIYNIDTITTAEY